MISIGIVRSTGSSQGDKVLRGVYGIFAASQIAGGVGSFCIAPEFKRISHLFSLLDGGHSPASPGEIHTIEVEPAHEHLVKAQLMHAMASRWHQMYQAVAPGEVGLLGSMINAESNNVSTAAKSHLVSMGMRAYLVPVTCKMSTQVPGQYLQGERDLIASLRFPEDIKFADGDVLDLGTDVLVSSVPRPAHDQAPPAQAGDEAATPPPPAWASSEYMSGVAAEISASLLVIAPSIDQVRDAAELVIRMSADADATGITLELMPEAILSVQPLQYQGSTNEDRDFDPDFDGQDDHDDRPRGG